mmetsp:Transcript_17674/g.27342  ORF Transcript_17674/g.27342 Transcript_17674/m.27342 type:complete len:270 (+) Transcript_17674:90-899(+)
MNTINCIQNYEKLICLVYFLFSKKMEFKDSIYKLVLMDFLNVFKRTLFSIQVECFISIDNFLKKIHGANMTNKDLNPCISWMNNRFYRQKFNQEINKTISVCLISYASNLKRERSQYSDILIRFFKSWLGNYYVTVPISEIKIHQSIIFLLKNKQDIPFVGENEKTTKKKISRVLFSKIIKTSFLIDLGYYLIRFKKLVGSLQLNDKPFDYNKILIEEINYFWSTAKKHRSIKNFHAVTEHRPFHDRYKISYSKIFNFFVIRKKIRNSG